MKKGLFCLILGIVGLGLMSCGDDESKWSSICNNIYEQSAYATTSLLTKDQKSKLKKVYIDRCVDYYDNIPACENEYYDYMNCHWNISDDEWKNLIEKDEECENQYPDDYDLYNDCVAKIYPCTLEENTVGSCLDDEKNEAAFNKFDEDFYSKEDPVDKLLEEWGIDHDRL